MATTETKSRDRRRGIIRRPRGEPTHSPDWNALERLLGPLPAKARNEIIEANQAYAKYGLRHGDENTLSFTELKERMTSWSNNTSKLTRELRAPSARSSMSLSRDEIISHWRGKRARIRLLKMTPLEFFAHSLTCAIEAKAHALSEIENGHVAVASDLWSTWVCLIANACLSCGVKPTAGGRIKGEGSPFVLAIESLQKCLPEECQLFTGYDSIRTNVQGAKRRLGKCSSLSLMTILMFWGERLIRVQPDKNDEIGGVRISFNGSDWQALE